MKAVQEVKSKGGWRTLGIWVMLTFLGLMAAWYALITIASQNVPEPVPLNLSK